MRNKHIGSSVEEFFEEQGELEEVTRLAQEKGRCESALAEYEASDERPMTMGEKEAFRVGFAAGAGARPSPPEGKGP